MFNGGARVYDFEAVCRLLAAAYNQAWTEARRGDESAICFLDHAVPSWREWEARRQLRSEAIGIARKRATAHSGM